MDEVSDASFREYVKRNPKTVAYFYGLNCPNCRQTSKILEELSEESDNGLTFVKVCDIEAPKTFREVRVLGVPTVILFAKGNEAARLSGHITKHELAEIIKRD